jgi:hypothetical protein
MGGVGREARPPSGRGRPFALGPGVARRRNGALCSVVGLESAVRASQSQLRFGVEPFRPPSWRGTESVAVC